MLLNCVILGVANLRAEEMRGRIAKNKGEQGRRGAMATRVISYLFIDSVALLLVDGLVGGLTLVFIDSVAHLLRTFLGIIFWRKLLKRRQLN